MRVKAEPRVLIDRMSLEQAIPYAEMSNVSDELLLSLLKCEKYELIRIDERGRVVLNSRSLNFIFYIELLCFGEKNGDF